MHELVLSPDLLRGTLCRLHCFYCITHQHDVHAVIITSADHLQAKFIPQASGKIGHAQRAVKRKRCREV